PHERRVVRSFAFPVGAHGPPRFVDSTRFLVLGNSILVVDATSGVIRERWEHGLGSCEWQVIAPNGRRVFIACRATRELLVLDVEDPSCSPPQTGLVYLYSGDGTMEDAANVTELAPHGYVSFVPGKVGQAFFFDGTGAFLQGPSGTRYGLATNDS